jgi:hypothetical protein
MGIYDPLLVLHLPPKEGGGMFALQGGVSGELLSFRGRVLVHDNRAEMEFLFPKHKDGQVRIIEVKVIGATLVHDGRPTMPLKNHPDLDMVKWPLDPKKFVPVTGDGRRDREAIVAGIRRAGEQASGRPTRHS